MIIMNNYPEVGTYIMLETSGYSIVKRIRYSWLGKVLEDLVKMDR